MATTDAEIQGVIDELVELYGDKIPDPEQEPRRFHFMLLTLWNMRQHRRSEATDLVVKE